MFWKPWLNKGINQIVVMVDIAYNLYTFNNYEQNNNKTGLEGFLFFSIN